MSSFNWYRVEVRYLIDMFDFTKSFVVQADTAKEACDEAEDLAVNDAPNVYATGDDFGRPGWALDGEGDHYTEFSYSKVDLLDADMHVIRENINPDDEDGEDEDE